MEGDPAIRWQVMRDLLDRPQAEWEAERSKVATEGWGKAFLDLQDEQGTWSGGIYSPKWTSTTFTMLTLIDCGVDPGNPQVRKGAEQILQKGVAKLCANGRLNLLLTDLCVWGFYLHITAYCQISDPMLEQLSELLFAQQMEDGGWNCRALRLKNVRHGSFHTTFNVLEGLRAARRGGLADPSRFLNAEARAMEFMLQHRMYRSDKTGEIVNPKFTQLSYPPRWHYDILRGLDYIRATSAAQDPRLEDALQLLQSRENNGIWPSQNPHAGLTHFKLEPKQSLSCWNTLRALRVLRACQSHSG